MSFLEEPLEDFSVTFRLPEFNPQPVRNFVSEAIDASLGQFDIEPTQEEYNILATALANKDGQTYADTINSIREDRKMPFNLGGFLTNAAGILTGQGILVGPQAQVQDMRVTSRPPATVPTYSLPTAPQFENILRGTNFPGTVGFGSTNTGVGGSPLPSTDFFDFGDPGVPSGGTAAQKRTFLLKIASANVGSRVTARDVVQMAKKVGIAKTQQLLGLEEQAVCFIIVNVPKRRRRGITARDISRTKAFANRLASANAAVRSIKGPTTTRRRPAATRSSTITTVK